MTYTSWIPDVVADGTIESAWGNAIRDRTLTPFANAAARATAIPTPKTGMCVYMLDSKVVLVWNGTKWTSLGRQTLGFKPISGNLGFNSQWYDISAGGFTVMVPANCQVLIHFAIYAYKVVSGNPICGARAVAGGNVMSGTYNVRHVTDMAALSGLCCLTAPLGADTSTVFRMDGNNNSSGDIAVSGYYSADLVPA